MPTSKGVKRKVSWRKWRKYLVEFNRIFRDNIRAGARLLETFGFDVKIVFGHKTTLILKRPPNMSWVDFKNAIASAIQPSRGSALVFSATTGNSWMCSNRGNRPGRFVML